ncbi:AmpG family muropeptide MFS transporter [Labrys monachus]|uniref:PAT family beta-lactamase induction signal transducer AmpG n=1 Tax=Labrys monachus TaxID=217067 RepID=A0ABU0FQR1_9HYPH|nr:MFS transporter [Labrys monachus]MDQ0396405.1 PAT family beta-lactamase induction signal transducer AmpG [Labrys monachus]
MNPIPKLLAFLKTIAGDRRLAFMLALGFSSGLPFLLIFSTQSARLREAGVSLTDIGLISYVALAYSLKFAWAPFIDRFDPPGPARFLGRRRGWMVMAQAGVALGLIGLAFNDPGRALWPTIACAAFTAFCAASQDVVIDGWRIDVSVPESQGMMLACYQLGYRLALLSAGAGALYLADFLDWRSAYLAMMGLMLVGVIAATFAPDGPPAAEAGSDAEARDPVPAATPGGAAPASAFARSFVEPLGDLFKRLGWMLVPILVLVALYRLPDFVSGVMANPLYIDLGFTKSDIATVSKLYGIWIGMIGAFAGGISVARLGLMPTLLCGGIVAAASHLSLALLAASGAKFGLLTLAISIENFAGSFAGTALAAYMSSLTSPAFAATQYALLSSLYALPGKILGGLSGKIVDTIGYPAFFISTSTIGVPVAILCLVVWYGSPRQVPAAPAATAAR